MDISSQLFLNILRELDKEKILKDIIVIGGWCLLIYRHSYGNPAALSSIRTADIDFLISTNHKFTHEVDIGNVFSRLGFEQIFSGDKGFIKYVHPEMEAEFLVPLVGRHIEKPYTISALKTNAQRLRFLDMMIKYIKQVNYFDLMVTVPEPAAYVINKLIVSTRRSDFLKKEKDLKTAIELGEYILDDPYQKSLLLTIFGSCSSKIRNSIFETVKINSKKLYSHFCSLTE